MNLLEHETPGHNRGRFSVNVIYTGPFETADEALQFDPPVINSLGPTKIDNSRIGVNSDSLYYERVKALSKIRELQNLASDLNKKIRAQEDSLSCSTDGDFVKKTSEKIEMVKKREKKLCDCNQSCGIW